MDKFHTLLSLIDRNSDKISEGDYLQICNILNDLYKKVKPPYFLLDQNEPMTLSYEWGYEQLNSNIVSFFGLTRNASVNSSSNSS